MLFHNKYDIYLSSRGLWRLLLDFGKISIYKNCKCQHDLLYQLKVQTFITTLGIFQHVDIYV